MNNDEHIGTKINNHMVILLKDTDVNLLMFLVNNSSTISKIDAVVFIS